MAKHDIADGIGRFLKLAANYFHLARMADHRATMEPHYGDDLEGVVAAREECHQARANLVKLGHPLADELDARGDETTCLRLFLHAIDGGGGPSAAMQVWPAVKVQLQQMRARLAGKAAGFQPTSRKVTKARWLATAMLLVRDHPEWPDAEIADKADIDPSQLSRSPEYQRAAELARSKANRPQGYIKSDPDTGRRTIEAIDPDD